jgi:hypothetical protein
MPTLVASSLKGACSLLALFARQACDKSQGTASLYLRAVAKLKRTANIVARLLIRGGDEYAIDGGSAAETQVE